MLVLRTDCHFDGARFVDGDVAIAVEGGVITRVEPVDAGRPLPPGAVDARGQVVMPGMVNAHVHIARGGVFEPQERVSPSQAARNLGDALAAGTTTVGDMGCAPAVIAALRRRAGTTPSAGPQIRCAGPLLTAPGGYPLDWMPPLFVRLGLALPCADERAAGRAVERVARAGMDFVKLAVMHQSYSEQPIPAVTPPVARAVVEAAHRSGLRVLAHAHSVADYRVALAAGVDALMHSSFEPLDPETVARVRDAGIPVCPTLWVFDSVCLGAETRLDRDDRYTRHVAPYIRRSWRRFAEAYAASGDVVPPGIAGGVAKARAREAVRNAAANLRLLREAGVPIAFGNDASYGFSLVARPVDELTAMQRAGMDAEACLRAATSESARLLGCSDRGVIRPGARADLLVVDRAVRKDVAAMDAPREVIAAGTRLGRRPSRRLGTAWAFARGMARTVVEGVTSR
ncbi:MAG TPA: amidohydrolase family protein [Polyangiaceae bacterium]|jgi:imidazolonepropionase-like amidohydrolase